MLRLGSTLNNLTIMSLHAGYPVGIALEPIINPHNLTIIGVFCNVNDVPAPAVLLAQDIREMAGRRLIIDNAEDIRPLEDLIRDRDIINIRYQIPGKKIVTESKARLGKAEDYIVNDTDFVIRKVHVVKSAIRSLTGGKLIVDREQIVATDDTKIIVKDGTEKIGAAKPSLAATPTAG